MNINEKIKNLFQDRLHQIDQNEEIALSVLQLLSQRMIAVWIKRYVKNMMDHVLELYPDIDEEMHELLLTSESINLVYGGLLNNGCDFTHDEILGLLEDYWKQNVEIDNNKSA